MYRQKNVCYKANADHKQVAVLNLTMKFVFKHVALFIIRRSYSPLFFFLFFLLSSTFIYFNLTWSHASLTKTCIFPDETDPHRTFDLVIEVKKK